MESDDVLNEVLALERKLWPMETRLQRYRDYAARGWVEELTRLMKEKDDGNDRSDRST